MTKLIAQIRVIILALPTRLVALSTALVWLAPELARIFPNDGELIAAVTLRVVAAIAAAIAIIRKVTPVPDHLVGILPQTGNVPPIDG